MKFRESLAFSLSLSYKKFSASSCCTRDLHPSLTTIFVLYPWFAARHDHHLRAAPVICSTPWPPSSCCTRDFHPAMTTIFVLYPWFAARHDHHLRAVPVIWSTPWPPSSCCTRGLQYAMTTIFMLYPWFAVRHDHHLRALPVICSTPWPPSSCCTRDLQHAITTYKLSEGEASCIINLGLGWSSVVNSRFGRFIYWGNESSNTLIERIRLYIVGKREEKISSPYWMSNWGLR
jgi:hypothetical protein